MGGGRRRKAPVSRLRARLGERMREKEVWPDPGAFPQEKGDEPPFPVSLFYRMHRYFLVKVTVALAVVFLAGFLHRGNYTWARPVIGGLRYAVEQDLDWRAAAGRVAPAFRAVWDNRGLLPGGSGNGAAAPMVLPLEGRLRSGYGLRVNPQTGREEMHYGIDLAAAAGTAVRAVLGGRVAEVAAEGGVIAVILEHEDGWESVYRGLGKAAVSKGDTVERGGVLGFLGAATLWDTPHLHFELRFRGRPLPPPAEWLAPFAEPTL